MQLQHLFPPPEVAVKIVIALGVGFLVGLEREWAHKDVGVRTFAVTSLLGMLGSLLGNEFALLAVIGCLLFIVFMNLRAIWSDRAPEITTSVSLMVVCFLGILTGRGHLFTPVASAIILTHAADLEGRVYAFRRRADAAGDSQRGPHRAFGAGDLSLAAEPLHRQVALAEPARSLDYGGSAGGHWLCELCAAAAVQQPRVLLRGGAGRAGEQYGGGRRSCALGASAGRQFISLPLGLILLTRTAMFVRNLAILVIFAPAVAATGLWPLLAMALAAALIAWIGHRKSKVPEQQMKISSPVSLRRVFSMGAIFVAIQIASTPG